MALTAGRYQTCPTTLTPSGYLLIAFLNQSRLLPQACRQQIRSGRGCCGLGVGVCSGVAGSALLCFYSGWAFILLCPLGASSFPGVLRSGQRGRQGEKALRRQPIRVIKGGG